MLATTSPAAPALAMPDDAVVIGAVAGAGWAWEALYPWLAPPLAAYFRSSGLANDAEDLVAETFLRMVRAIDRFEGDAEALRAWSFAIARNLRLDRGRRAARRGSEVALDAIAELAAADDPAADVAALDTLLYLLGQLTDGQREVMALRVLGDLTAEQIAHVTGARLGKVKSLLRRGGERLAQVHAAGSA